MSSKRISENELIIPALFEMNKRKNGYISTSELIKNLRDRLTPTGEDIQQLTNRKDDKFSQKVRNLVSHDTLTELGFAIYKDSGFIISDKGRKIIDEKKDIIYFLDRHDFTYDDVLQTYNDISSKDNIFRTPIIYDEQTPIIEGETTLYLQKRVKRSEKLREIAIDFYTKDGKLTCECCGFSFPDFYGKKYGNYKKMEIHHKKPIYSYEDYDAKQVITSALENVVPVCPNCHRVIHLKKDTVLPIEELKKEINLKHSFFFFSNSEQNNV